MVPNEATTSERNSFPRQVVENKVRHGRNLKYYFFQYCSSTSIHGMQYLGERDRYIIEKICWFFMIVIIASVSSVFVMKTYHKWVTSPVIVSFATTETPISSIPFPAVTICPETKSDAKTFNFTRVFVKKLLQDELTQFEQETFEGLSLVCNSQIQEIFNNISNDHRYTEDHIISTLADILPDTDPLNTTRLEWLGDTLNFEQWLTVIFSSAGVCYSFNMLDSVDILKDPEEYAVSLHRRSVRNWTLDKGYQTTNIKDSFPLRSFLSGPQGGVRFESLTMKKIDLDYMCTESLQGYKVVLHHPGEWPNLDRHFRVPIDSAVYVGIKPILTTVSPTLKNYDPVTRKCYFTDERELAFFHNYTQNNCLQECLSNYTLRMCDCLGFYMPKDKDTRICGRKSLRCLQQSKVDYLKYDKDSCFCLPSCTSLEYDVEISYSKWEWSRIFDIFRILGRKSVFEQFDRVHMSRLVIYFKDNQFLSSERSELYGTVDFLSSVGGLLGLFIGISLTSFIEAVYFCTLRLYCNFKKYGAKYWSGEPNLIDEEERNDVTLT